VKRDINLPYDEPWGWMMPARHVLGALLLDKERLLRQKLCIERISNSARNNLWSLLGLRQALKQQQKMEEADLSINTSWDN